MTSSPSDPRPSDIGLSPGLQRARNIALIVGVIGGIMCVAGYSMNRTQFLQSYLIGYLFWLGIALGCVPIILVHHLVGGRWGFAIRKPLEAGALTIPLMAVLYLPIVFGLHTLYPWSDPSYLEQHPIVKAKSVYLHETAFLSRAVGYFLFWSVLSLILNNLSKRQDHPETERKASGILGTISGPALLLHVFVVSFAGIDWIMSLEPEWYSTIFGPLWMVGQILTTMAFMILVIAPRSGKGARPDLTGPGTFNDLGNLLLAFVMLWAYMQLSQFLIIWSGNLLEEIPWYLKRTQGGWQWIAITLIGFQFILPFLALLQRESKRRPERLARLAALIVVMNVLSIYWIIAPAFTNTGPKPHLLDAASVVGMGGLWIAAFLTLLGRRPSVPGNAPPPIEENDHAPLGAH